MAPIFCEPSGHQKQFQYSKMLLIIETTSMPRRVSDHQEQVERSTAALIIENHLSVFSLPETLVNINRYAIKV